MDNLLLLIENYMEYCSSQKRLDKKTLKAYSIDLRQFTMSSFPQHFFVGSTVHSSRFH